MSGRLPQTLKEQVLANCRPQPAIPAVLVLLLMVLLPAMSARTGVSEWQLWLIPAGVLASAGLAIAAGFCSLAPQFIWVVLSWWGLALVGQTGLPGWCSAAIYFGMMAVSAMFFIQIWRVVTGRFVPTVNDPQD
jgi:hypothetical protein